MQIKTRRYYYTYSITAIIRKTIWNVDENVEKLKHLSIASGNGTAM